MPSETLLRFGVVGVGRRGRNHIESIYGEVNRDRIPDPDSPGSDNLPSSRGPQWAYREFSDAAYGPPEQIDRINAEITAVCDPSDDSRKRALAICDDRGDEPTTYESFGAFLDDAGATYDAAIVSSPNDEHAEQVCALLDANAYTFSEKPLATTLADHDRIADAADRSSTTFYPGFNLRHSPLYRRLKALIDDGAIGDLGMLSAREIRRPFPGGHYYSQERSGGSLLEKDCHDFDLFNWIACADPARVAAFGGQHVLSEGTDVNDHATVVVEYHDGTKATLELCLYAPFQHERGRLYAARGSDGVIRSPIDDPGAWALYGRNSRDTFTVTDTDGSHDGADARMWRHALRAFAGEVGPLATPRDAKRAAAVAIAAETAIAEDRVVEIDDCYDLR